MDTGILDQLQSLVIDASQVVSYKWLSRTFLVSSNAAKRILQDFVKKNEGNEVEVVYAISGWLKGEPQTYTVQLVPKAKLQEAKQGFDGSASHHVYSVQPCLPKDLAQLVSAELVQAQELFLQPSDVDNCLRDNRFSSVSYARVTRSTGGSKSVIQQQRAGLPSGGFPSSGIATSSMASADSKASEVKAQVQPPVRPSPIDRKEAAVKATLGGAVIKEEAAGKISTVTGEPVKVAAENVSAGKKKVRAAGGGSLANLWGKAPAKVKATSPPQRALPTKPALVTGDAEAGIRAMETDGSEASSDEEMADFARIRRCQAKNIKGRKRQVVFEDEEMSDNEEVIDLGAVMNLASPEPFKQKTQVNVEERANVDNGALRELSGPTETEVDEDRANSAMQPSDVIVSTPEESGVPSGRVKREGESGSGTGEKAPSGPKRKKVLKTRIDSRGREVIEVVWETDGMEESPEPMPVIAPDKVAAAPVESKLTSERPAVSTKSTSGPLKTSAKVAGKGGGKPAPKITSFFKKKT